MDQKKIETPKPDKTDNPTPSKHQGQPLTEKEMNYKIKVDETMSFVKGVKDGFDAEMKKEEVKGNILGSFEWLIGGNEYNLFKDNINHLWKIYPSLVKDADIHFKLDMNDEDLKKAMVSSLKSLADYIQKICKLWEKKQANEEIKNEHIFLFDESKKAVYKDMKTMKERVLERCVAAYSENTSFALKELLKGLKAEINFSACLKDTTGIGVIPSETSAPRDLMKLKERWVNNMDDVISCNANVTEMNVKLMERALFVAEEITKILFKVPEEKNPMDYLSITIKDNI